MGPGRKSGIVGATVVCALGASVLVAPTASAADPKVKLPDRIKASTGFPVEIPIKVKNDSAELRVDWGNGEHDNTYTGICTNSTPKQTMTCTGNARTTYYSPGEYTVTVTAFGTQVSETGEQSAVPLDTETMVVTVDGAAVPKPFSLWREADVEVSPLPETTTAPVPFTVTATRENGAQACSAEFATSKIEGPGPWQFTYDPVAADREVTVRYCDGGYVDEYLGIRPTYSLGGSELVSLTREHSPKKVKQEWSVRSQGVVDATIELVRKGKVLDSAPLPAGGTADLKETLKAKDFPTGSTRLTVRATGTDGAVMEWPITVAKGWSSLSYDNEPTFAPCSTVTWAYNKKGAPKSTSKMRKTARQAFKKLGKKTGLNFVETKPGDIPADIRISWGDLRHRGSSVAGVGGPAGDITLSTTSFWPRNSHAGMAKNTGRGIPGNGWLVMHEALHVLGLGHTDTHGELMSSRNYRDLAGFGKGDMGAIRSLYQPKSCG